MNNKTDKKQYTLEELQPLPVVSRRPHVPNASEVDATHGDHSDQADEHEDRLHHVRVHHSPHAALQAHHHTYLRLRLYRG